MPPRRWNMGRRTQLSEGVRRYLEMGSYGSSLEPEHGSFDYDAFGLKGSVLRGNYAETQALWVRHGARLLEEWVTVHPGCRPFAWWVSEAPEPRRVLRGIELLLGRPARDEVWWRPRRGVPFFVQVRPVDYIGYPAIESEAHYLERLGLLADEERARVQAEDWEPVEINPFCIDDRAVLALIGAHENRERTRRQP